MSECKYRCRTNRAAYEAGWKAALDWAESWYEDDNPREDENMRKAYREWRKGVKGDD